MWAPNCRWNCNIISFGLFFFSFAVPVCDLTKTKILLVVIWNEWIKWLINWFIPSCWERVQSVGDEEHIDSLEDVVSMWSLSLSEGSQRSVTVNNQPRHYITHHIFHQRHFYTPSGMVVSKTGNCNVLSDGNRGWLTPQVKLKIIAGEIEKLVCI